MIISHQGMNNFIFVLVIFLVSVFLSVIRTVFLSVSANDFEDALESFIKAVEINPNYAEAYYNHGNLLCEIKKFDESIFSYNKAIKINPNYTEAYNNLGLAFTRRDSFYLKQRS